MVALLVAISAFGLAGWLLALSLRFSSQEYIPLLLFFLGIGISSIFWLLENRWLSLTSIAVGSFLTGCFSLKLLLSKKQAQISRCSLADEQCLERE